MNRNRTINTFRNTLMGITAQTINIVLSFITRTVFIKYLSIEYLGVNGLFSNILTMLSLVELGFGSAVVYSMYKPLALNNHKRVAGLMNFYASVYSVIGCTIGVLGLLLVPFLGFLLKDQPKINHLTLIYILFLSNSVISYFFAHKRSIISADQRDYILSRYRLYFSILRTLVQIVVLILVNNFITYLLVQIASTFIENLFVSIKVDKLYPYLSENKLERLEIIEKKSIWNNVNALMIYKLGSTILDGTDNIIIAALVGVVWVGKLSNYTLIVGSASMIVSQFTNAITASVGNFIVRESKERQEFLLKTITFANFIIYGSSSICLYILINSFIKLWIGADYVLSGQITFVITLNWYISGMMNSVWTFRSTMGLFVHGRYRPAISAVINVVVSILLAKRMGLFGVLLGTMITRFATNVWYDPLVVYRYGLQKSVKSYYRVWLKYLLTVLFNILFLTYLSSFLLEFTTVAAFIIHALLCVVIIPLSFWLVFGNTKEFQYLYIIVKRLINKQKKYYEV